MAIELVRWQPNHYSGWELWQRALTRREEFPGIEIVLWECFRRFPDNLIFRNRLADVQVQQGRYCEAEYLLRSNIESFPRTAASYRKLAELLARQPGRLEEAIPIGNQASRLSGYRPAGISKLLKQIAGQAENPATHSKTLVPSQHSAELMKRCPDDGMVKWVALNGRAMLAEFRLNCPGLGVEDSAVRELQFLANEADLPLARFLLARSLPNYDPSNIVSAGVFPVEFVKALRRSDNKNWESVTISARSADSKWLVRIAKAVRIPKIEDHDVAAWLSGEQKLGSMICSVLQRRLTERISGIDAKGAVVIDLQKRKRIVEKALADVAAMMFDEEIAA